MELHEYPRPANDTGIGVHWVTGFAAAVGMSRIREYWIPELKALGVKWVKIPNHDGAADFAELLLAEGIMPVVRLFQSTPNPGRLGVKEIVHLDSLVRVGVRYFEFNNEPDTDAAWKGGRRPSGAIDLVTENVIANFETILEHGGMPAVPAISGGSDWDLVGRIVAHGRRDLFAGPIWQAIHNYPRNRPLDFPFDIGSQEGAAYTERFYRVVAEEDWGENAWRGRTLSEVNRLRLGRANPGMAIQDDHNCWLAYLHFDELNRRHLGRSIPILSTECGYIVGEDSDPRYPATTPDLQMAQTLEACRVMMGTSTRFSAAPDFYFCTAFWLLANRQLGSSSDWWEGQAWYSARHPGGVLPLVRALRAEPKHVRRWQQKPPTATRITLRGSVLSSGDRRAILLTRPTEQGREEIATTTLDIDGQYVFADLAPGRYVVVIPAMHGQDEELAQEITLTPDASNVVLNFDLAAADGAMSHSTVVGTVRGGAGAVVMLLRASDGEEWVTLAQEDGCFKFVDLPPGLYSARVHPAGTRMENIALDGRNEQRIELAVSGWGHTVHYRTDDPRAMAGVVRCTVDGHKGVAIHVENRAGRSEAVQTGGSPEFGPYAAELTDIAPGDYLLVAHVPVDPVDDVPVDDMPVDDMPVDDMPVDDMPVDDMPVGADEDGVADDIATVRLEARIYVDRKQVPEVLFVQSAVHTSAEHRQSQVHGRLHAPQEMLARPLTVTLVDGQARRMTQATDPEGNFSFTELGAGAYFLEVVGFEAETRHTNIALDGANTVQIDLALALPAESAQRQGRAGIIAGFAPAAAGKLARLVDDVGNEYTRLVNKHDRFFFDGLPAGAYTLSVEGGYVQPELQVPGESGVEVLFSPVESVWSVDVNHAGAMPGFSILRVQVDGSHNLPVHIWQQDGDTITRRTGSNTEFGDDVAEFGPLEPGDYMVEADGVALQTQVELTGLEVLWVHFQRKLHPLTPHLVRPLAEEETRTLPPFDAALYRPESTPVEETTNVVALPPGSASTTYVLIGEGQFGGRELQEIVAFATQHHAQVGRHIAEALQADVVAVVGQLAEGDLSSLRAADVAVKEWSWSTEPGPVPPDPGELD